MIAPILKSIATTGVVFGVAVGALEIGLPRPTASDLLAARVIYALDHSRGRGALLKLNGRTTIASCQRLPHNQTLIRLSNRTNILASGTHIVAGKTRARQLLAASRPPDLAAAELDLAGSHLLYSQELTARLKSQSIAAVPTHYGRHLVYALKLRPSRPMVKLLVDRLTLQPLAAIYRSTDLTGTSQMIAPPRRTRRGPSRPGPGC